MSFRTAAMHFSNAYEKCLQTYEVGLENIRRAYINARKPVTRIANTEASNVYTLY